jgi:DNA modification methylase
MQEMPAESIDTIVTSPPYWGLRDYGVDGQIGLEPTLEEYHTRMLEVTAECMRVLKPTGVMFWNHGDSYNGSKIGSTHAKFSDHVKESQTGLVEVPEKRIPIKSMTMQNERLIIRMIDDQGWVLRNRIIWCLASGTKLYVRSQKGIMPMTVHDMVRLDPSTIQLWNGDKWTQVLGWSETPPLTNQVEVVLRSGERIRCTSEHKFPTERGMLPAKELKIGDIMKSVSLPQPTYPDFPNHLPDESIGWFIGTYLADGSLGDGGNVIQISSHVKETERYKKLCEIADEYGGTCNMYNIEGNSATINLYSSVLIAIIKKYISGNTAHNKHLLPACWNRCNGFLEELLRGYLEGDGHYDADNDRWRLGFTRNYALESDLRTISARLGISVRINRSISKIGDKEYPSFRGEIRFSRSDHWNTKHDTEIVKINRARSSKFWSIGVADEPHVFALASGILTSNSKPNGMPSSVTDRFSNKYEPVYMLVKSKKYWFDLDVVRVPHVVPPHAPGNKNRIPMTHHFDKPDRIWGDNPLGKNPGDVWKIPTQPYKESHFAVFPTALIEPMIRSACPGEICPVCGLPRERIVETESFITRPTIGRDTQKQKQHPECSAGLSRTGGHVAARHTTTGWTSCSCGKSWIAGTVLDPFAGSGTVGEVARKLNRNAILLELNPEYERLIIERTMANTPPLTAYFGDTHD